MILETILETSYYIIAILITTAIVITLVRLIIELIKGAI